MVLVFSYVLAMALGKYVLISPFNYFISGHTCRDFLFIISFFSLVVQMLLTCSGSVETIVYVKNNESDCMKRKNPTFDIYFLKISFAVLQ